MLYKHLMDTLIQHKQQTHQKKQDKYNMYFIDSNNQW